MGTFWLDIPDQFKLSPPALSGIYLNNKNVESVYLVVSNTNHILVSSKIKQYFVTTVPLFIMGQSPCNMKYDIACGSGLTDLM